MHHQSIVVSGPDYKAPDMHIARQCKDSSQDRQAYVADAKGNVHLEGRPIAELSQRHGHSYAQCHVVMSAAGVHAVSNAVEFILVDGGILQSRSSAIQIGPESHANFGSLVFQNISIEQSHRWALP